MTPVQSATLPLIISGIDVLAKAKTGTGKTLAFLIPSIEVNVLHSTKIIFMWSIMNVGSLEKAACFKRLYFYPGDVANSRTSQSDMQGG